MNESFRILPSLINQPESESVKAKADMPGSDSEVVAKVLEDVLFKKDDQFGTGRNYLKYSAESKTHPKVDLDEMTDRFFEALPKKYQDSLGHEGAKLMLTQAVDDLSKVGADKPIQFSLKEFKTTKKNGKDDVNLSAKLGSFSSEIKSDGIKSTAKVDGSLVEFGANQKVGDGDVDAKLKLGTLKIQGEIGKDGGSIQAEVCAGEASVDLNNSLLKFKSTSSLYCASGKLELKSGLGIQDLVEGKEPEFSSEVNVETFKTENELEFELFDCTINVTESNSVGTNKEVDADIKYTENSLDVDFKWVGGKFKTGVEWQCD